jgi:hypothetical protein
MPVSIGFHNNHGRNTGVDLKGGHIGPKSSQIDLGTSGGRVDAGDCVGTRN